jgi:hypothetical protein
LDLILIEGVPGSGKSTLAEMLYDAANSIGINASWHLEESRDHPVHNHKERPDRALPEYYLGQWEKFILSNGSLDHLFIIEGSLFQSNVRFMMEDSNEELIPSYFSRCESLLAQVSPKLIYLRPAEISQHIDWVMEHRGEEWSEKVSRYIENTPFCSSRHWQGASCMRDFWSYYANICDFLVSQTTIPSHTINCGMGSFKNQFKEAFDYINLDQGLNKTLKTDIKSLTAFQSV